MSLSEGPQLGAGFHEAAIRAQSELMNRKAEEDARRVTLDAIARAHTNLKNSLPDAPQALQDVHDTAMRVMPPDEPLPASASISGRGIALGFALSFLFWGVIGGVLLWIRRMM
jgi:hypothetical protein